MPIINAFEARTVFVLKRGKGAGFSGVENPLFTNDNTVMLYGDAKQTVSALVSEFSEECSDGTEKHLKAGLDTVFKCFLICAWKFCNQRFILHTFLLVFSFILCYNRYVPAWFSTSADSKKGVTHMYYLIKNTLEQTEKLELNKKSSKFAAVMSSAEWLEQKDKFDMGIEMDIDLTSIHSTKAEVNYDSLTGTFSIPDRNDLSAPNTNFAFALDEKGIVFIDDSGLVSELIATIIATKRWTMPSLERFLYDFLEQIVSQDQVILERFDKELDTLESEILFGTDADPSQRASRIRSDLRDLRIHYEQLLDLGQELEENENSFFKKENTRYFHLFTQRVSRLHDMTTNLREYSNQIRDLYQSQLDKKQNRIMALLTVISSIFMPLTLIAGWYGMNFKFMPELEYKYAYPITIAVSAAIVIISLIFFKKKKWL